MAKAKAKTGIQSRSNLRFNNYHVTTSDFFHFDVAYSRELVPHQTLKLNLRTQARLAGMPVPSFADVTLNRRGFFVPYRVVWNMWNAFIEQQPYPTDNGVYIPEFAPSFNLRSIITFFQDSRISTLTSTQDCDFILSYTVGSDLVEESRDFTDLGRHSYKLFTQLGYSFQLNQTTKTLSDLESVTYNALPLLCLTKVYMDWFVPTQYRDFSSQFVAVNSLLGRIFHASTPTLNATDMYTLFRVINFVFYGHDYFTDAFDHPTGNNSLNPSLTITDPVTFTPSGTFTDLANNKVSVDGVGGDAGTPVLTPGYANIGGGNRVQLTQFALNALTKLTAFMKRRQIAGSRILENYLSEYGVKLPSANLDMSVYLNGDSVPVIIRDVTATSQTLNSDGSEGANLGDYAGQGRISPDSMLRLDCDSNGEFGLFVVVTSLVPRIGYVQGVRRQCLHVNPLDFFHGDFDGLGNRDIRKDELATPELSYDNTSQYYQGHTQDEIFGFTPQYSEYKVQHDTLSGDFRIRRLNQAGFTSEAWHLNRMFIPESDGTLTIPSHSMGFCYPSDKSQYSRIFYVQESENLNTHADHFVLNHIQQCETSAPFKPLYEDYTLEHIDGNNSVTLDVNGNYMT